VRGVDFDIGFLDEVWFCHDSLMIDGFFPVAMKKRSALIMATTPGPPTALFARLIALKDEKGNAKMRLIRSGQPCETCQKGSTPWTCLHTLDEKPPWKDASKESRLMWMYAGNTAAFLKEQMGMSSDEAVRPIQAMHIAQFRNKALWKDVARPKVVYLAMDPASSGKCEFSIMAGYFTDPLHLVVSFTISLLRYSLAMSLLVSRVPLPSGQLPWWMLDHLESASASSLSLVPLPH
jgi:hypothetical protein